MSNLFSHKFQIADLPPRLQHLVDMPATCESHQDLIPFLWLRDTSKNTPVDKYVKLGCGNIYTCYNCGSRYTVKKYHHIRSLIDAIWKKYPDVQIGHLVFTLPTSHSFFQNETHYNYNKFLHAVNHCITNVYSDVGFMLALHNWSSSDPEEKNIHIHAIVIGINSFGFKVPIYTDLEHFRSVYSRSLNYEGTVDLYVEYFTSRNRNQLYHCLKYAVRSPILDYIPTPAESIPLSTNYLERISHYYRFHRLRYYGWLSPRNQQKTLQFLNIKLSTDEYVSTWQVQGVIFARYDYFSKSYQVLEGYIIPPDDIIDFADVVNPNIFINDSS